MMNTMEVQSVVKQTVNECRDLFIKKGWVGANWNVNVKISFSHHRNRSWGGMRRGRPFISLALNEYVGTTSKTFYEYSSFSQDKEIGTVSGEAARCLKALVCHEMAHAVQFSGTAASALGMSRADTAGHGALWKHIYRVLRNKFVNGKEVVVKIEQKVTPKRSMNNKKEEVLAYISLAKQRGIEKAQIIRTMVNNFGYSKNTANVYYYQV